VLTLELLRRLARSDEDSRLPMLPLAPEAGFVAVAERGRARQVMTTSV